MSKTLILAVLIASSLVFVSCSPTERGEGAAAGAAIGALAGESDKRKYYGPQGLAE